MGLTEPDINQYPVELLAANFQITGRIKPLGDILSFLNDPQRATLVIEDAQATPVKKEWRAGVFSGPDVVVPKSEIQCVLIGELTPDALQLLPKHEDLIVYTDTYAVRGRFHTGEETPVSDVFHISRGPFFPASDAEVFAVQALRVPIEGATPLLFVNKDHVALFHQQNGVLASA